MKHTKMVFRNKKLDSLLALCLLACMMVPLGAVADYVPPPTLGIGIIIDSGNDAFPYLHAEANDASEIRVLIPIGGTVEIIGMDGDEWYQVNHVPYEGYIRKEHVQFYSHEAIFPEDITTTYEAGTYTVAEDMASGLYVFTVPKGVQATLDITLGEASRQHELTGGYGVFTYYLPEQAQITLSDGSFMALEDRGYDFSDRDARYAQIGRFFTAKNISAGFFVVELAPGATSGYYVVSSIADDENLEVELVRVEVKPGDSLTTMVPEGMIFEYYNCYSPGNG